MIRFTVIVPTCGRDTLSRTLASIPVDPEIEVLVVGDGEQPTAKQDFLAASRNDLWRYFETEPTHSFGNFQRDQATKEARGRRLVFMDDDDVFTPNAWDEIKRLDAAYPSLPLMFRMAYGSLNGRVLWATPEFSLFNVGGSMFMPLREPVPNWTEDHTAISDFGYMLRTLEMQPGLVWGRAITCIVKPEDQE